MQSALLVAIGAGLWATDALFRHPLVQQLSPFTIVYFEHIFATAISFLFLMCTKDRKNIWLKPKELFAAAFIGICGSAIATVLFTMSFQLINPSVAILLQKVQPIFVIILSFLFLGETLSGLFFFWAFLAFLAAYVMSFPGGIHMEDLHSTNATGCLFAFIAAVLWAVSTVAGKMALHKAPPSVLLFWRFLFGLLTMYFFSRRMEMMRIEIPFVPSEPQVLRMLFAMALVPGFIGVSLYYKGLKKVPASAATILELTFPVCALAVNQYFLHFHLLTIQWIAAFALLLSMIGVSQAATASLPMRLLRRPKS